MSFTPNLNLEEISQGQVDWHTVLNANLTILDTVIGKIAFTDGSPGTLAAGMPVYISAENTLSPADATGGTKPTVAICRTTDGTTATIRQSGVAKDVLTVGSADISAGDRVYLSTTAGKVTKTPPSGSGNVIQFLGWALTDEASGKIDLLLNINPNPVEV